MAKKQNTPKIVDFTVNFDNTNATANYLVIDSKGSTKSKQMLFTNVSKDALAELEDLSKGCEWYGALNTRGNRALSKAWRCIATN